MKLSNHPPLLTMVEVISPILVRLSMYQKTVLIRGLKIDVFSFTANCGLTFVVRR